MSDVYRSVSNRSLGDNLIESIKSFFLGIIMFLVSFPILWWNEGRTDMSEVAKTAVVVAADASGTAGEGKLVSVTADLKTDDKVGDPDYIAPGSYLKLERHVEMYAWNEKKKTTERKKLGGGSEIITDYTYDMAWTSSPSSGESFEHPEGHENPTLTIQPDKYYAKSGKVGGFSFDPQSIELPSAKPLTLSASIVTLKPAASTPAAAPTTSASAGKGKAPPPKPVAKGTKPAATAAPETPPQKETSGPARLSGQYVYIGKGSNEQPKLGDVRVSFEVVEPMAAPVTLLGRRQGTTVVRFENENGDKLFRVLAGGADQAVTTLHNEHVAMTWMLRGLGFFLMWIGLALFISPINAVLDIVPFVGSTSRFLAGIVMFPIALALATITILLSIVAHNPLLLIIPAVLLVGIFVLTRMLKKKKAAPAPAMAGGYGPPPGGYGPPPGGYGPPPGGGGYGPPPGGGGYGPPPGGGGYGGPPPGGGYGPPPG